MVGMTALQASHVMPTAVFPSGLCGQAQSTTHCQTLKLPTCISTGWLTTESHHREVQRRRSIHGTSFHGLNIGDKRWWVRNL